MLPPPLAPVAALLRRLPQWPPATALAVALNLALDRLLPRSALAPLAGKCVRLRVRDAGLTLTLRYARDGFWPVPQHLPTQLEISADADALLSLALRREDPDTLFFQRRLLVTGDTELGLVVKNALDAVEWPLPALRLPFTEPVRQRDE